MTFLQSCIDCKALSSHTGYHTQERELKPINDGFGYSLYSPQCSSIEKAGHRYQIAEDKDEQGQAYSAFQTLLVSRLLTSHWQKLVTWLGQVRVRGTWQVLPVG